MSAGPARGGIEALPTAPVVILCRTQMGENIGTAARAMLNFGLTELRLVAPACGWPNAKAVVAASGAVEVLNRLVVYPRPRRRHGRPAPHARHHRPAARDEQAGAERRGGGRQRPGADRARPAGRHRLRPRAHRPHQRRAAAGRHAGVVPGQPGLRLAQRRPGGAAVRLWLVPAGSTGDRAAGAQCRAACRRPRPWSVGWSTIWCASSTRSATSAPRSAGRA